MIALVLLHWAVIQRLVLRTTLSTLSSARLVPESMFPELSSLISSLLLSTRFVPERTGSFSIRSSLSPGKRTLLTTSQEDITLVRKEKTFPLSVSSYLEIIRMVD